MFTSPGILWRSRILLVYLRGKFNNIGHTWLVQKTNQLKFTIPGFEKKLKLAIELFSLYVWERHRDRFKYNSWQNFIFHQIGTRSPEYRSNLGLKFSRFSFFAYNSRFWSFSIFGCMYSLLRKTLPLRGLSGE